MKCGDSICPTCGQVIENRAKYHGRKFVNHIHNIIHDVKQGYGPSSNKTRGVAFQILLLLDGSGEGNWPEEYHVQVKCGDEWEDVEFEHHDLPKLEDTLRKI